MDFCVTVPTRQNLLSETATQFPENISLFAIRVVRTKLDRHLRWGRRDNLFLESTDLGTVVKPVAPLHVFILYVTLRHSTCR